MEASTTLRERENRSDRFMAAGNELAGLATGREHRAAQAAQGVASVMTEGAVEALAEESDARYNYFRENHDAMRDMGV